jgi:hypothetical protein
LHFCTSNASKVRTCDAANSVFISALIASVAAAPACCSASVVAAPAAALASASAFAFASAAAFAAAAACAMPPEVSVIEPYATEAFLGNTHCLH